MRHLAALTILLAMAAGTLAAQTSPVSVGGAGVTGTHPTYSVSVAAGATLSNVTITIDDTTDVDDVRITAVTGTIPAGLSVNPAAPPTALGATALFELTGTVGGANTPGLFAIVIDAEDDEGTPLTTQITLNFTITNTAPVLAGPSGTVNLVLGGADPAFTATCTVGDNLAVTFAASDANTGQTLDIDVARTAGSIGSAGAAGFTGTFPATASGTSPQQVVLAGTAAIAGTITLTITVDDNDGGTDTYTLAITINPGNSAPVLAAPSGTVDLNVAGADPNFTATCVVGDNLAITFNATDANGADNLDLVVTRTAGSIATTLAAGFTGTLTDSGTSPVSVTLGGTAAVAGTITLQIEVDDNAGGTDIYTLAITITVATTPNITVTGSLVAFTTTGTGIPSAEQSYTVSGTDLTANIVITAPTHFQVSTAGGGVGFGAGVTLTQAGGTVAVTTIFVRFNPSVTGVQSGNITHTSTGATTRNQAVTGSVAAPAAAALSNGAGNPGPKNVAPGSTSSALVFRITETGGGTAWTLNSASIDIATNTGAAAFAQIVNVRLRRGGTVLATITNGGAGWSTVGSIVTANFTGLTNAVAAGATADYTVTITFAGTSIPTPRPSYVASVTTADITGTAAPSGATVTGGQLTLAETIPDDPFADDDDDDDSCQVNAHGRTSWALLLMLGLVGAVALRRRRA